MIKVLVVEDQDDFRELVKLQLIQNNCHVDEAPDLKTASWKIEKGSYDVFILDVKLPDGSSIDLFDRFPEKLVTRSIIITANATIPGVVQAIKKGAFNYLEKPVDEALLIAQVKKIVEINRLRNEHHSMVTEVTSNFTFDDIIYESKQMQEVIDRAKILATTDNTVLIQGETGVGKEVLAYSMHNLSKRKDKIFLPLNCASIPTELFESELFGFEKGAFTGAVDSYCGRFIQANNGTLFLDEIGEFPLHIQAKLLRILDERAIYRLKSKTPIKIDVRLIAATNRDLIKEIKLKQFRSDLYYRLIESAITISPLRERVEDILPLIRHFIQVYNRIYNKDVTKISKEAENYFLNYSWEGNVRELKNTIKSIIPFKVNNIIEMSDLSSSLIGGKESRGKKLPTLEEYENEYMRKVLKITSFNITRACEILGISRPRFYRRLKDLQLEDIVESGS
ncbi:MAG: sigma-54-dependent Fis family transcriptional regulator [Candidatus Aminicenantes bacterium]|nr:MAG: sigma-54-dependent Fis family transcriptional regulator [Candidatus Aminicenantes bacterium]